VLVVAGVMAATLVVAVIAMRRVGSRAEGRADGLRDEAERLGEEWLIPLSGAEHQGARQPYVRGKGRGVLGLTDRRLVFLPIAGDRLGVPLARVTAARMEDRRRDAAATHRHRVVVVLDDGAEVGFLVDDPGEWEAALARLGVPTVS
ncbi:MAG: hypothetical protein IH629_07360, partial [Thermoleophilia bacterium]|nr:hypothetical protein [Thermoleophilia bacterium]